MFITPKAVDKEFYVTLIVIDEDDITKTKEYYPKSYYFSNSSEIADTISESQEKI